MKTSLWIVIAIVSGLVGFLMGYSLSSYTGFQSAQKGAAKEVKAAGQPSETSTGKGADSGGYGEEKSSGSEAAARAPAKETSGGYGSDSGGYGAEKSDASKAKSRGPSKGSSPGY